MIQHVPPTLENPKPDLNFLAEKANKLFQSGQYETAIKILMELLTYQPKNDSAMHMLAHAEHKNGNTETAIDILTKALSLNPNNIPCNNLLAYLYVSQKKLGAAEKSYQDSLSINPSQAAVYKNIGLLYSQQKKWDECMKSFANAVLYDPDNLSYKQLFVSVAQDFNVLEFDSGIKKVLISCLEEDHLTHRFLEKLWIVTLHTDPSFSLLRKINPEEHFDSFIKNKDLKDFIPILTDSYFLLGLSRFYLTSIPYEKILTSIRKFFLLNITSIKSSEIQESIFHDFLPFLQSLALQCWMNEYVYIQSDQEEKQVQKLQKELENHYESTPEYLLKLTLFACYKPLHHLKNVQVLLTDFGSTQDKILQNLITAQVKEPLEELEIRKTIPTHGKIDNKISQDVRNQYEKNPYPRWKTITTGNNATINNNKMDILVAGCGTGQQPASMTHLYPKADFLCVDLSLSSLSYAIRQCRDLNLPRIKFIQSDILQLGNIGKTFDKIYCSGVLHHMEEPEEGLKVLKQLLKPNGIMQLSLYSKIARPHITAARNYIKKHKIDSTAKDIRHMREIVINGTDDLLQNCMKAADFFTLSQCRDLLFHVQEHQFTIPQIREMLHRHDLYFLGFFYFSNSEIQQFLKRFPEENSVKDLNKWEKFEQENPDFFMNKMYNFRVRHKENTNISK